MKNYINNYIKETDNYIQNKRYKDIDFIIRNHLRKIKFFQHERLIHLLVTLFYAIFSIIFTYFIYYNKLFILVSLITYISLIFYIFHYFFLENSIQYMYKQYDKLTKIAKY